MLADDALREEFYARLTQCSKTLAIALSSEKFVTETDDDLMERYKAELKRFHKLRVSVKMRYAESIDYRDYEPKIRKLLDTHIQANEVIQLNEPVNIFDDQSFNVVKEDSGVYSTRTPAAQADSIAHALKKAIHEHMEEDPAFYDKFSKMIQEAIDQFRQKLISGQEYLSKVTGIRQKVVTRQHDDMPAALSENADAMAYYGVALPVLGKENEQAAAGLSLAVQQILQPFISMVHFWDDEDAKNEAENRMDDYLFDELRDRQGVHLSSEQMDELIESLMRVAKKRTSK